MRGLLTGLTAISHRPIKMGKRLTAIALLVLTFGGMTAQAVAAIDPYTASRMGEFCRTMLAQKERTGQVPANFETGMCVSGISAIHQMSTLQYPDESRPLTRVCAPPGSGLFQKIRIFVNYMDAHPELGHKEFAKVALQALWQKWPCLD